MKRKFAAGCSLIVLAVLMLGANGTTARDFHLQAPPPYEAIRLERGAEFVSQFNYYYNNGTVSSATQHSLSLFYKYEGGYVSPPTTDTGTTGGTAGTASASAGGGGSMIVSGAAGASPNNVSTGSSGTTGGTTGNVNGQWYIFVANGTGFGKVVNDTGRVPTVDTFPLLVHYFPVTGLKYPISAGDTIPIQWGVSGTMPTSIATTAAIAQWIVSGGSGSWQSIQSLNGNITEVLCPQSGIDTRLTYQDGDVIPATANEGPRNLNFNANFYKGGNFVGCLPMLTGDQSGLARSQFYPKASAQFPSSNLSLVFISMLHMGCPSVANTDVDVGLFAPATTDPNYLTSPTNVTWQTRWNITPRSSHTGSPDFTQDPVNITTLLANGSNNQGAPVGDYACWNATYVFDQQVTYGGQLVWETIATTPETVLDTFCLAMEVESTIVSNGTATWHWLEDASYQGLASSFPYTDGQPRMWVVQPVNL